MQGLECARKYLWSIQAKCSPLNASYARCEELFRHLGQRLALPGDLYGLATGAGDRLKCPGALARARSDLCEATHVSSTELLFNWLPLLGTTEPGASTRVLADDYITIITI